MNLHVEYQKGDFRNARRLFFSRTIWMKVFRCITLILVLAVFIWTIINVVMAFRGQDNGHNSSLVFILVMGVIAMINIFDRVKYLPSAVDFEITEEGVTQKTWNKTIQKKWDEFSNYAHSDTMLIVVYPSYYYMALPKHSMNDIEWNKLLNTIKENIRIH
jgi:hypothetical protein